MSRVLAIVWKEWRQSIDTPMGYVVAVAFLLASGFFFGNTLFLVGQADMRGYFQVLPMLFMFFIPALTMRLLAEERHAGTFELLATLPVREVEIVAGKLMAVLLQLMLMLALTLVYPASLSMLGNVDGGAVAAAYLGALLLAGAYAAICLFASSLTRNAVVAYVLGFGMLLFFFLIGQASPEFSSAMQDWLTLVNPVNRYQSMLRGVVSLGDVLFMLMLTLVFAGLTRFQLERRKWS
ncbi:MAG TPA: ABC transporter permease subunit [Mariprofundaceae bacterium]|nr:ABC transporter permease subunit [Mariprofundaceae bacterium]